MSRYDSLLRSFTTGKERGGPMELGDLPFPFIVKRANPEDGCTRKLHVQQQEYTFRGGVGQEKPDSVCTAEYFL